MATEQPQSFGALLQRARAEAGLTQEQLAARAGMSATAVATLERGPRRSPHTDTIQRLAQALDLPDEERETLLAAAVPQPARDALARDHAAILSSHIPISAIFISPPTALVGRTEELETIHRRLADEGVRLLTLTGPAGVGKTRLALAAAAQLADHFPGGVGMVDLSLTQDPQLMLPAIASALGLGSLDSQTVLQHLQLYLRERDQLLLLDNFEQVLPAATQLAELLAGCPSLALLVTSRVPLRLRWEQALRVAPLAAPDLSAGLPPPEELAQVPAITLFLERARAQHADFALTAERAPLVSQLVVQLDGLPLALELAAARLDVLSLSLITRRLADRLQLLRWKAPDLPERQQSLEAAVGWSYDLLNQREQRLFRCLGVFMGRVSLDAVTAVASDEGDRGDERSTLDRLMSLAEKSLALPERIALEPGEEADDEEPEPAFGMLETVREYAWEQLQVRGELAAARRAHAHYYVALAERADPLLRQHRQRAWFLRLEREHENMRAALRWLLEQDGPDGPAEHEAGLRLASALAWFWWLRGYHAEGLRWLEQALARAPHADPAVRTHALLGAGMLLFQQREFARALAILNEALGLAQRRQDVVDIAWALTYLGGCTFHARDKTEGLRHLEEALARWQELNSPHAIGTTLYFRGSAVSALGDDEEAAALLTQALERLETVGDARLAGNIHINLAMLTHQREDLPSALHHVQAGLRVGVALRDRRLLSIGVRAALALVKEDADPVQWARLLGAADTLIQTTGASPMWEHTWKHATINWDAAQPREHLEREGLGAVYRAGRSLPFGEVATLALSMVEDVAQTLERPENLPIPTHVPQHSASPLSPVSPLSPREQEVLRLVAQGLSNKATGRQLFITASTVNYHLTSIFHKLAVDSRAQAVAVAAQRGLL